MDDHFQDPAPQDAGIDTIPLSETAARFGVPGIDTAEGDNLDRIRDILFGTQSRDRHARIGRLEDRLARDTADLRDDANRRFLALEAFARTEIEALAQRAAAEQAERSNAIDTVTRAAADASRAFERQLAQIDEQSARAQRGLRDQILEQSKTLADDIRRTSETISAALDQAVEALRREKADRSALAALLSEMAVRLTSDLKAPGGR